MTYPDKIVKREEIDKRLQLRQRPTPQYSFHPRDKRAAVNNVKASAALRARTPTSSVIKEVIAIETVLGEHPQGEYKTVAERLMILEKAIKELQKKII